MDKSIFVTAFLVFFILSVFGFFVFGGVIDFEKICALLESDPNQGVFDSTSVQVSFSDWLINFRTSRVIPEITANFDVGGVSFNWFRDAINTVTRFISYPIKFFGLVYLSIAYVFVFVSNCILVLFGV